MVTSAGILLYRRSGGSIEVLLGHLGGPFWARKDTWSIPKGELETREDPFDAARREFAEELGVDPPHVKYTRLGEWVYSSGKRVIVFAGEGEPESADYVFGTFEMEWPPRSGRTQAFPEVDRAEWMTTAVARPRLSTGQRGAIDALEELVA